VAVYRRARFSRLRIRSPSNFVAEQRLSRQGQDEVPKPRLSRAGERAPGLCPWWCSDMRWVNAFPVFNARVRSGPMYIGKCRTESLLAILSPPRRCRPHFGRCGLGYTVWWGHGHAGRRRPQQAHASASGIPRQISVPRHQCCSPRLRTRPYTALDRQALGKISRIFDATT